VVLERLTYPGGCASSFLRGGPGFEPLLFESGATLSAGLDRGGLFGDWIERLELPVEVDWLDPVIELRCPDLRLAVGGERGALERRLVALPEAPVEGLRGFFAHQRRVADVLWGLLDEPALLPPLPVL
jgi:phytoene dehydrogenase-like protein